MKTFKSDYKVINVGENGIEVVTKKFFWQKTVFFSFNTINVSVKWAFFGRSTLIISSSVNGDRDEFLMYRADIEELQKIIQNAEH